MSKEWKGNSKSGTYSHGIKTKCSTETREADDFYATDPQALDLLINHSPGIWLQCEFMSLCENKDVIWECACGNGNLSKVLEENGLNVYSSDLKDRGYGCAYIDFLENKNFPDARVILTNPPYSLANEFILHALDILPDYGLYIALMNINYLAGIKRFEDIYSKGCLREVYVFKRRISCWKNNIKDSSGHMLTYAWYVFQKGYKGQPTLYWL